MSNNKLRVGIVGYGIVGHRRRLFIDKNPYLKTTAVCDVRFKNDGSMIDSHDINYTYELLEERSLEKPLSGMFDDGIQYYNNYLDLLDNSTLDILFVCPFLKL